MGIIVLFVSSEGVVPGKAVAEDEAGITDDDAEEDEEEDDEV
jgi:hypothetical protein